MFPALIADQRLQPKDFVFALRSGEDEKAWPVSAFEGGRVINDRLGDLAVVLIGDAATRTVRAYRAGERTFAAAEGGLNGVVSEGATWRVEEEALVGEDGERLVRLPGHIAYWFAWSGFRAEAPLYEGAVPGIGCGGKPLRVTRKLGAAKFPGRLRRLRRFRGGRPGATSRTDDDLLTQVIVFGRTLRTDVLRATV